VSQDPGESILALAETPNISLLSLFQSFWKSPAIDVDIVVATAAQRCEGDVICITAHIYNRNVF
jgi:hypothetical protein